MPRGRKRKTGVPRTASGRISQRRDDRKVMRAREREQTEVAAQSVALAARLRLHGVPEALVKDQRAGSVVGLMTLAGILDDSQYEAAMRYLEIRNRALRSIDAPGLPREPSPETLGVGCGCMGECMGLDDPCDRKRARQAIDKLAIADAAVSAAVVHVHLKASPAPNEHRLVEALHRVVIGDQSAPELELALRHALNALHRHFFVGQRALVA